MTHYLGIASIGIYIIALIWVLLRPFICRACKETAKTDDVSTNIGH